MCPRCSVHLIPIIYGNLTPDLLDMEKEGKLIIGNGKFSKNKPTSFCISCEEAYDYIVLIEK
jgi:hypothetical protein